MSLLVSVIAPGCSPWRCAHYFSPTVTTPQLPGPTSRSTAALALLFVVALAACAREDTRSLTAPTHTEDAVPAFNIVPVTAGGGGLDQPSRLDFATYDGSSQVVHPDVLRAPEAWGGQLLTVVTPYPNSQTRYENPSVFSGTSGETWAPLPGGANPVATTTRGYLSDPDLVYDPSRDEVRLYFREVVMAGKRHVADNVYYMTSPDGVRWSERTLATATSGRYVVSPSVVRDSSGAWRMWAVDAGSRGCKAKDSKLVVSVSTDGRQWSPATAARFAQPGYVPWHLDVQWVPSRREYWALVAAYPLGETCMATSLFLSTSTDGETWTTYPAPVLARGTVPQFAANVYRSSLVFDSENAVTLWMSGARSIPSAIRLTRSSLEWSAAVARTTASALLARVNRPVAVAAYRLKPPVTPYADNDVP